ncbi:hypothetical protein GOP47_0026338 [Adiantum capillus-veneris]|nr:hypothetical protein GOP47_0026338 [Adiantum capillus-veneris]
MALGSRRTKYAFQKSPYKNCDEARHVTKACPATKNAAVVFKQYSVHVICSEIETGYHGIPLPLQIYHRWRSRRVSFLVLYSGIVLTCTCKVLSM